MRSKDMNEKELVTLYKATLQNIATVGSKNAQMKAITTLRMGEPTDL